MIDPLWPRSYAESFLEDVHRLLCSGYARARNRINAESEEDEITGFLTEALEVEVRNPVYLDRYEVHEQKPVHSSTRTGGRRQRIDLVFFAKDPQQKREFCCEAKRLKTSTNTIGAYTGAEGMGCFVKCEYAADQPIGAMLGYIQSSAMDYWHKELIRSLANAAELSTQKSLASQQIISEIPHEWLSVHQRVNGEKMSIYHIFLDCS